MEREIEIIENENELILILPRTGRWAVIVLTGFWCLVWVGIFVSLADIELLSRAGFAYHVAGFALIWLFIFRIFLWHVIGKEKIVLNREHLTIKRLGTFLTFTRKFEVNLIDDFRYTDTIDVPRYHLAYGFAGGYIVFEYWDHPEYFGQSLDKKEAQEIAMRLNDWKEKHLGNTSES
jgi:hypothetical protein